MGNFFRQRLKGLLVALFLAHLLWLLFSFLVAKPLLPSPVLVYQVLPSVLKNQLWAHLLASLVRIFAGMTIALVFGTFLGILMGRLDSWNQVLDPLVYLVYPIPKLALLPLLMLFFGLGELSKISLIVLIVFPQVVLSVRDAVKEIPADLYDIYQGLRASSWQKFRYITLPATYPALLSTSRITLGTAISVLFFTENYGTNYGMGYFIMDAWMRMDYPLMYSGILTLSLVGLLLFIGLDFLTTKNKK